MSLHYNLHFTGNVAKVVNALQLSRRRRPVLGGIMQYASLVINRIIMHEILRGVANNAQPQLSDVPAEMPDTDRVFIQERIRKTLSKDARPIVEEAEMSIAPEVVRAYLQAADPDIALASQKLAKCLQGAQSPVSPGGIFVFDSSAYQRSARPGRHPARPRSPATR